MEIKGKKINKWGREQRGKKDNEKECRQDWRRRKERERECENRNEGKEEPHEREKKGIERGGKK